MTLMMNSLFGLDDMEALLWGPSSLTADPMGSPLRPDEEGTSTERGASPLSSSFSSSSPPPLHSPSPPPPSLLLPGDKAEVDMSLAWLSAEELGHSHVGVNDGKEDAFSGLDWMAERVDLNEFDLDSLMDCCSPDDEPPSSPEDLVASLECPIELDALSSLPTLHHDLPMITEPFLPTPVSHDDPPEEAHSRDDPQQVQSPPPCVPEIQEELEIKSEPVSPGPCLSDPPSPAFTLDLGSEVVVVSDCDRKPPLPPAVVSPQVPRIVFSLSPTRIVLLLAPRKEVRVSTTAVAIPELASSSSIVTPFSCSTPLLYRHSPTTASAKSPWIRPYTIPKSNSDPRSPSSSSSSTVSVKVKVKSSGGGRPPKEKKLKKMEQNKTAATRYRQKKRVEQEALNEECGVLERKNEELEEQADSLAREIQYLKELMEEVRFAKSLKGSTGGSADL